MNFIKTALAAGMLDRMDEMNDPFQIKSSDPKPIQSSERPIVAAAIVFIPIIVALLLVICFILLHK